MQVVKLPTHMLSMVVISNIWRCGMRPLPNNSSSKGAQALKGRQVLKLSLVRCDDALAAETLPI